GLLLPTNSALAKTAFQTSSPFEKLLSPNTIKSYISTLNNTFTPQVGGTNLIQDPSFEAGGSGWGQSSTNFGTPLCTIAICTDGGGTAGPHTGSVWGWFGGVSNAPETAELNQYVTFPQCSATLQFYFWIGYATPNISGAQFSAFIDNNPVFTADSSQQSN